MKKITYDTLTYCEPLSGILSFNGEHWEKHGNPQGEAELSLIWRLSKHESIELAL